MVESQSVDPIKSDSESLGDRQDYHLMCIHICKYHNKEKTSSIEFVGAADISITRT